nr:zinc ribbon domain-containing protein [Lachnospiraceae bacterium]
VSDGRLIWEGSLAAGEKFNEISVTYPTDAYAFNSSKTVTNATSTDFSPKAVTNATSTDFSSKTEDYNGSYSYYDDTETGCTASGFIVSIFTGLFMIVGSPLGIIAIIFLILKKVRGNYKNGSGFASQPATKKKITRTLITYYPECPSCAAPRPENADKCAYCGRSFIKSEEILEEKEIPNPEQYSNEGTFRYGTTPNTYVRVHVTHIPIPRTTSRSSCAHSSCAHSSCACAHSCACACACACAGGGRAGCSTKDFYNTDLKLKQLKRRDKKITNREIHD